jgi:hypothetical protein
MTILYALFLRRTIWRKCLTQELCMVEEAIKQMIDGDIRGLEEVVKHYQEKAVQIAFLITHDPVQAQDCST